MRDVEGTLIQKSWWAAGAILPFARRLIFFVCNYTEITPNSITFISLVMRIIAGLFFLNGGHAHLVCGALSFEGAYLIDCADGSVARLKNMTSTFGRYFDHMSDLAGGVFIICCLAAGQGALFSILTVSIVYIYISEYYITYLVNIAYERKSPDLAGNSKFRENKAVRLFCSYRNWFFRKNFKSFLSLPDVEALTFFFFPLMGYPLLGLRVGFYLIIVVTLYKILSSFITIHVGEELYA